MLSHRGHRDRGEPQTWVWVVAPTQLWSRVDDQGLIEPGSPVGQAAASAAMLAPRARSGGGAAAGARGSPGSTTTLGSAADDPTLPQRSASNADQHGGHLAHSMVRRALLFSGFTCRVKLQGVSISSGPMIGSAAEDFTL